MHFAWYTTHAYILFRPKYTRGILKAQKLFPFCENLTKIIIKKPIPSILAMEKAGKIK